MPSAWLMVMCVRRISRLHTKSAPSRRTHLRMVCHPAAQAYAIVEVFWHSSGHAFPCLVLLHDQHHIAHVLPLRFDLQLAQAVVHFACCCTHGSVRLTGHAASDALARPTFRSPECALCFFGESCSSLLHGNKALSIPPFYTWFQSTFFGLNPD